MNNNRKGLYRVVDSVSYAVMYIGTEKECVNYVEKHKLNKVFIEPDFYLKKRNPAREFDTPQGS